MDRIVMAEELIFMREDLEEQLLERFPWLEQGNNEESMRIVPCFVGVGWFHLLSNFFLEIEILYRSLNKPLETIRFHEIKEKYGLLRICMEDNGTELQDIINTYENLSAKVCEICGEKGELRDGTWCVAICDVCLGKRK